MLVHSPELVCGIHSVKHHHARVSRVHSNSVVTAQAQNRQRQGSIGAQLPDDAASCVRCLHDSKAAFDFVLGQTRAHSCRENRPTAGHTSSAPLGCNGPQARLEAPCEELLQCVVLLNRLLSSSRVSLGVGLQQHTIEGADSSRLSRIADVCVHDVSRAARQQLLEATLAGSAVS